MGYPKRAHESISLLDTLWSHVGHPSNRKWPFYDFRSDFLDFSLNFSENLRYEGVGLAQPTRCAKSTIRQSSFQNI